MVVGQRKTVRIDVWIIIAKQIAAIELAIDVTEDKEKEKVCQVSFLFKLIKWKIKWKKNKMEVMKIIMFEENLFVLKQEFHDSLS